MHHRRAAIAAILCAAITPASFATSATWISPTGGNWLTPTNWSTNPTIPNAIDDSATLGPGAVSRIVTLNGNITLGNLTFDSPFGNILSTTGSTVLTFQTSSGPATITNNATSGGALIQAALTLLSDTIVTNNSSIANLSISGRISGAASLTLNGPSPIVLSANNSLLTGNLFLNAANVTANVSNALGAGHINLNPGSQLTINSATSNNFILNGGTLNANTALFVNLTGTTALTADSLITATGHTPVRLSALAGSSNLTLSTANFSLLSSPANSLTGNVLLTSGATFLLGGALPGATVTVNPGTQFTFVLPVGNDPALNSFAPGSVISNNGEVGVSADIDFRPALSANSTLSGILFNTNNATLGGANSLDMNAFSNPTTLRIGGTNSIAATMDIRPDTATHTFRFGLSDYAANNLTVNTPLTDHDAAPANLDINGGNTILTANNTFSGTTAIANGTLTINNANALGTSSGADADGTAVNSGGTLKLGNITLANEKVTLNPGGTLSGNNIIRSTYADPITLNGGTLGNATFSGTLSGSGDFNVNGANLAGTGLYTGNLTFTGSSTISNAAALSATATTTLAAGTLTINQPLTTPLIVTGGTTDLASGVTWTASSITVSNGTIAGDSLSSVYANNITMNGGTLGFATFTGNIGGSGNFTINGSTLSGTGTYTGTATFTFDSTVTTPTALSPSGTTVVQKGNISINAPLTVPLTILYQGNSLASNVTLNGPVSAPVVVNDGSLFVNAVDSQPLTINNGNAYINAPSASAIFVNGSTSLVGAVTINAAGAASVVVNGGTVFLNDTVNAQTGAISINNGTLAHSVTGTSTLAAPLQISGNVTIQSVSSSDNTIFNINSPVTGSGFLKLIGGSQSVRGTINLNAPLNYSGVILASSGQNQFINFSSVNSTGAILINAWANFSAPLQHTGDLSVNGSVTFSGPSASVSGALYASGTTTVNTNLSAAHLISLGTLQGNGTISTTDNQLTIRGGNVNFTGSFSGIDAVNVTTAGSAQIMALPASFAGPINVQSGILNFFTTGPSNPVYLSSAATLYVNNATVNAPVFLNSSNGSQGLPALYGNGTLAGPVDFGPTGASANGTLTFSGPLSGNSPTFLGQTFIYSSNNSLHGIASINATTILQYGGVFPSASGIQVNHGSLYLDNSTGALSNRLGHTIPIALNGGAFTLAAFIGTTPVSESIGQVSAIAGADSVIVAPSLFNNQFTQAMLTVASLVRSPGATFDFSSGFYGSLGASVANSPRLFITGQANTPFMGGAYTVNKTDFAKYTANGVTPMSGSDYFTGPESAWNATTTVSLANATTLTASRVVNAIRPDIANSTSYALNLNGNTLNLQSGGLLGSIPISGGAGSRLTAGGTSSAAELFLTNYGAPGIPVAITDNPGPDGQYDPTPGGPLDADNGVVSVVFSGGSVSLSGNNTYSGTTYINGGGLAFSTAASVPRGDLVLNTGALSLGSSFTASFSNVTIRGGNVGLNNIGTLSASSFNLEAGQIAIPIAGAGPLSKTGPGTATLASLAAYTGNITLAGGVLSIPLSSTFANSVLLQHGVLQLGVLSGPNALWRGSLAIGSDAMLEVHNGGVDFAPSSLSLSPGAAIQIDSNSALLASGTGDGFTDSLNPNLHANIINSGVFNVTAGIKNVGAVSGSGGPGVTVAAGASLTADSIFQDGSQSGGIALNGVAVLRPSALPGNLSVLGVLAVAGTTNAWTGKLDLNNNDLIVRSTTGDTTTIANQIKQGFNGGDWAGTGGITTSSAATSHNSGIAILTGAQYAASTGNILFDGQAFSTTDILLRYTTLGDANADGSVDLSDLSTVLNHFGQTTPNWTDGNFDYAATIDLTDLSDVLNNFGATLPNPSGVGGVQATPEPTSLALLTLSAATLLTRRRKV